MFVNSLVKRLFLLLFLLISLIKHIYSKLSFYINIILLISISIISYCYYSIMLFSVLLSEHRFKETTKTLTAPTLKKSLKLLKTYTVNLKSHFIPLSH